MELIERILQDRNIDEAIKNVKRNKGAAGVDGMKVDELDVYFTCLLYTSDAADD